MKFSSLYPEWVLRILTAGFYFKTKFWLCMSKTCLSLLNLTRGCDFAFSNNCFCFLFLINIHSLIISIDISTVILAKYLSQFSQVIIWIDMSKGWSFTLLHQQRVRVGKGKRCIVFKKTTILLFWVINRALNKSYSRPHERAQAEGGSTYSWCLTAMTVNLVSSNLSDFL